ncbi:MAG: protoporphyrinogen oxidase [Bryobacterales bacterium]|nr:protoporphyrinogen oxidase [Bryobacterales bacterium]
MRRPVIIIGGGISGLSTAYFLAKAGIPSTLVEARPRLGGVIWTERVEGCTLEMGPDSYLAQKPWALELIRELGLESEVIASNDHLRKTYVLKHGRLVPLPDGLMFMVPTRILPLVSTRLLGWPTKFRMALEWFHPPQGHMGEDRSVAAFVEQHYGREAVDYLTEPLLSGVYGGDPSRLSILSVLPRFAELEARYGSLTKGVLHSRRRAAAEARSTPLFQTLRGGLQQLSDALAERLRDAVEVIRARAEAVEPGWRVRVNGEWLEAEHVVLACEAHNAGALLGWEDLASVPYSSSLIVSLGYARRGFDHPLNGFGFLVPRKERKRLVAATWVNVKFSHRAPEDKVLLRCFLGGEGQESILSESDESLLAGVQEELREIMGVTARPVFWRIARWPRSMAQYTVGHQALIREIEERVERHPGLHLAGNAYHGIGIPDCVRMGRQAAGRIAKARAA